MLSLRPPPPELASHRRIFYEQIMFTLQVGHVQKRQLSPGKVYEIKTLSLRPPIFGKKIKNFPKFFVIHLFILNAVLTH